MWLVGVSGRPGKVAEGERGGRDGWMGFSGCDEWCG